MRESRAGRKVRAGLSFRWLSLLSEISIPHLYVFHPVRRYEVFCVTRHEVFLAPQVTHSLQLLYPQPIEISCKINRYVAIAEVEYANGVAPVVQRSFPHLDVTVHDLTFGLSSEHVLVHRVYLVVTEKSQGEIVHLRHIAPDEHVGGQKSPKSNVGVLLVGREARVAQAGAPPHLSYYEHVRVVPMSGRGEREQSVLSESYLVQRLPRVEYVAGGAP